MWVVNATPRPLYPRERDPVTIAQEAVWAPRPVWKGAENVGCTGIRFPESTARSKPLYRLHAVPLLTVEFIDMQTVRDNNENLLHSSIKQMYPRNQ